MNTPQEPIAYRVESDALAYTVELWSEDNAGLEQILARALSAGVARAIFTAAKDEHPGRHIVLRHGDKVIDQS